MTKKERDLLRKAIQLLSQDDGWDEAMRILLPLAEMRSPAIEAVDKAKSIPITELPVTNKCFADGSFRKSLRGEETRKLVCLKTTCEHGHVERVKPATVVAGTAVFGSDADFCQYKEGKLVCEALVVNAKAIYEGDEE